MLRLSTFAVLCCLLLLTWPAFAQNADPAAAAAKPDAKPEAKPAPTKPTVQQTALVQAWQTRARIDTIRGRVSQLVLESGLLLVQSTRAEVDALDAETGRSLWSAIVGNPKYPTVPVAANAHHVAVANGDTLYMLDRSTGGVQWTRRLKGTPSAGPAITSERVYLPMLSGSLESYALMPKTAIERAPVIFFGHGPSEAAPVTSDTKLMWGTTSGNVYIDGLATSENRVRFIAGGPVIGRVAYRSPRLYFSSVDGFVYAIDDVHGDKIWEFSLGGPSRQSVVSIDGAVFAVADSGGLWKLSADTGSQLWFAAGVKQFVAASPTRVYAADVLGQLLVIDAGTGTRLGLYDTVALPRKYLNRDNDRIYLADASGYIACFREAGLPQPASHIPAPAKKAEPAGKKKPAAAAAAAPAAAEAPAEAAPKGEDPFAK